MLLDVGKFTKFHFHDSISTGTIIWGHLEPVFRVELVMFTKYEFSFKVICDTLAILPLNAGNYWTILGAC